MATALVPTYVPVRTQWRLAVRAWRARWSAAEEWRFWPRNYHGEFDRYFAENAYEFGEFVAHRAINGDLGRSLRRLTEDHEGEPWLWLRGALPHCVVPFRLAADFSRAAQSHPVSPKNVDSLVGRSRAFIRNGRFDITAAAIVAAAAAELRKKNATDQRVRQDYLTDCDSETCTFREGRDLWLRFRQATPEFVPDDVRPDKVAAGILLVACVENTIRDPVYVLRAADVLRELDADTLCELRKKQFEFVDGWALDMSEVNRHHKSIVGGGGDDPRRWWLSFDANRIAIRSDKTSESGLRAVGRLMQQIERIGRTAAPITLRRGDALVINNYRAFLRRKERDHFVLTWPWPAIRWLRVYYGFPKEHGHQAAHHGSGAKG